MEAMGHRSTWLNDEQSIAAKFSGWVVACRHPFRADFSRRHVDVVVTIFLVLVRLVYACSLTQSGNSIVKLPSITDLVRTVPLLAMMLVVAPAKDLRSQVPPEEDLVELNLSGTMDLPKLVEVMEKYLGTKYVFAVDNPNRPINAVTPAKIPRSALKPFLDTLLRSNRLAVVDSSVPGWKRIVDFQELRQFAPIGKANEVLEANGPASVVSQIFALKHADAAQMEILIKSKPQALLSDAGAVVRVGDTGTLIVTDFATNVKTIADLLEVLDQPAGQAMIDFYPVKNRTAAALKEQTEALLGEGGKGATAIMGDVKLFEDASGKRVIVAGQSEGVANAIKLLQQLDSGADFVTKLYRLENIPVTRLEANIKGLVRTDDETSVEMTIDEEGNSLIVRAPDTIHQQIKKLLQELDIPVDATESPYQFYKLRNANAEEVLFTLLALQQVTGTGQNLQTGGLTGGAFGTLGGLNVGGVNPLLGLGLGGFPGLGNANQTIQMPPGNDLGNESDEGTTGNRNQNRALGSVINSNTGGLGGLGGFGGGQVATLPGGARITADVATNSLIVYAPKNIQLLYEKLIRSLDQRRPQVMIEAQIVAIDTSNNFSFGVEVSFGDREGASKLFKFTSFGLSVVDTSGNLTVNPARGFNGVLVDPGVADAIVQALVTETNARVIASPKILVNDNATGTLTSVNSVPFQSVNASDTVATTSLGGSQEAGTTITVTPHINEDDHLQLEFDVEFSTFADAGGTANLPPPRQIQSASSIVTIPDGGTIVVGGLKRVSDSDTFNGVPWLERIPIIRELTSLSTEAKSTTSFFLFIRPKILRDSRFRDLKYLSDVEAQLAQIQSDAPSSRPLLIQCPKPAPSTMTPTMETLPRTSSPILMQPGVTYP